MVEIAVSIQPSLQRFVERLLQQRRIEAVYLYGSQAQGTHTAWSDIDVAVVSPDFADNLFEARLWLLRLAAEIDDRIEPAPFTPEDFNASDPLVHEIQCTGVRLI